MANRYLDNAAAQAAPYESAATAANALGTLTALALAVDEVIWVNSTHVEIAGGSQTLTSSPSATPTKPQRLLCVSDFDASPGTLVTTPSADIKSVSTSAFTISFAGNWWVHGCKIRPNQGGVNGTVLTLCAGTTGANWQVFDTCNFTVSNNIASDFALGSSISSNNDEQSLELLNCDVAFTSTGNSILFRGAKTRIHKLTLSGSNPTSLFVVPAAYSVDVLIENSNLTGVTPTNLLTLSASSVSGTITFRNCQLPSSTLISSSMAGPGIEVNFDNCDNADTNYNMYRWRYQGEIFDEATIKATTGGASDGTTGLSWRMATNAEASLFLPLYSDWIHKWVDDTATAITPSIECLVSGDGAAALNDTELWAEFDYISSATRPLATRVTDRVAQVIDAGANQAAGTTAWTGDGYTTERTHKLAPGASFTPTKKGYIRARVALAKASTTVYVDPVIRIA